MGTVLATISISLDGYVTGPDDAPGRGLGLGGERLHYWVFGGPSRDRRVGPQRSGRFWWRQSSVIQSDHPHEVAPQKAMNAVDPAETWSQQLQEQPPHRTRSPPPWPEPRFW